MDSIKNITTTRTTHNWMITMPDPDIITTMMGGSSIAVAGAFIIRALLVRMSRDATQMTKDGHERNLYAELKIERDELKRERDDLRNNLNKYVTDLTDNQIAYAKMEGELVSMQKQITVMAEDLRTCRSALESIVNVVIQKGLLDQLLTSGNDEADAHNMRNIFNVMIDRRIQNPIHTTTIPIISPAEVPPSTPSDVPIIDQ